MASAEHLVDWVYDAVDKLGERADFAKVAGEIWHRHETELRDSGELFLQALKVDPRDMSAINGLGSILIYRRELDAAEFFVRRALLHAKPKGISYDAAEYDLKLIASVKRQMIRDAS